jgi:hypothetical protein
VYLFSSSSPKWTCSGNNITSKSLPESQLMMLFSSAFLALASLTSSAVAQLPDTGNVTFFSDYGCRNPVYINSAIIGRDFCASIDEEDTDLGPYRSFIINERPWCDNGSRPYWNVFGDNGCRVLFDSFPALRLNDEGACSPVGSSGFQSYAFVCDGFDLAWGIDGPGNGDGSGDSSSSNGVSSSIPEETTSSTDLPSESTTAVADASTTPATDAPETTTPSRSTTSTGTPTRTTAESTQDPGPTGAAGTIRRDWSLFFLGMTIAGGSSLITI